MMKHTPLWLARSLMLNPNGGAICAAADTCELAERRPEPRVHGPSARSETASVPEHLMWVASLEVPARRGQPPEQGCQVLEPPGDQVLHVALALPGAVDRQQP